MDKRKEQIDSEIDCCVICGKPTEYREDTPIDKRECYVEGAGQLCRKRYFEIYPKQETRERVEQRDERNRAVGKIG